MKTLAYKLINTTHKEMAESLNSEKIDFLTQKEIGKLENSERLENLFECVEKLMMEAVRNEKNVDGETILEIIKERDSIKSRMNANLICYTNAFEIYEGEKLVDSIISNLLNYSREEYASE